MGLERRGCIVQPRPRANGSQLATGGARGRGKAAGRVCQRLNIGSRVSREVHARIWERPGVRFLRATRHSAGLDVSVKETSVCIVDETGRIVREVKVASGPEALLPVLKNPAYHFKRIGLEARPPSQWLYSSLCAAGLPVICVETRHMRAVLKAQINKTDRNDARGIAQMMRVGLYRPVPVKTLRSQKLRMLLTHRKLLQSKAIAIDNDLRGTLRNFG